MGTRRILDSLAAVLLAGGFLVGSVAAQADPTWNDRGMRSRHPRPILREARAPRLEGMDRYDQISHAPTATPPRVVPETLAVKSQRPWEPGARRLSPRKNTQQRTIIPGFIAGRSSGTPGGHSSNGQSSLRGGVRSTPNR